MDWRDYDIKINYKEEIRKILIDIAHKRGTITYDGLLEKSGIKDNYRIKNEVKKPLLFKVLREVMLYEYENGRPCLTIIVVSSSTKKPSIDFYGIAEEIGVKNKEIDNEIFLEKELEDVYGVWEHELFYRTYK